eukprot:TRINITY_DN51590_c0_g1_i1.p1 TRINITY_DN51590_c0_g1~~TRINITY_DN51590_c0_g1_i1.p1  ORF type:complete len:311 (-),score=39.81 TRINITY_DN51590_c0_g1_i1:618-1550(-)
MPWYDEAFCPGKVSWHCWFQQITKCSETDESDTLVMQPEELGRFRPGNFTRHYVPDVFRDLLQHCSNVKPNLYFHWWHTQATTFIVRFNAETRHALDRLRQRHLRVHRRHGDQFGAPLTRGLPRGTVAMHVRHGDKGQEVSLLPFERYVREAARLAGGDQSIPVLPSSFSGSKRTFTYGAKAFASMYMFISTENPEVINSAVKLAKNSAGESSWSIYFSRENRTNVGVVTMRNERGRGPATLQSFLNLELALEAEAFVCTLMSNWCQLIDELRMTAAGKVHAPYVNLLPAGHKRGEGCPPFDRDCYIQWR